MIYVLWLASLKHNNFRLFTRYMSWGSDDFIVYAVINDLFGPLSSYATASGSFYSLASY
jgi:hypothetical protein